MSVFIALSVAALGQDSTSTDDISAGVTTSDTASPFSGSTLPRIFDRKARCGSCHQDFTVTRNRLAPESHWHQREAGKGLPIVERNEHQRGRRRCKRPLIV